MQLFSTLRRVVSFHGSIIAAFGVGLAVAMGVFLRLSNLGYPNKQVFDEVYFPVFAAKYLTGQEVFDVHPPLGKFIIGIGIWLFGDTPFGWRIVPALVGILLIGLIGLIVWNASKSYVAVCVALALASLDGFLITYSRTSLMDGILVASILLVVLAAQMAQGRWAPYLIGLSIGAAVAIKWPAIAVCLLIPLVMPAEKQEALRSKLLGFVMAMTASAVAVYTVVVSLGQYLGGGAEARANLYDAVLKWHAQTIGYHSGITDTHPWGSPWWTWPIPLRPVLFLYDSVEGGLQVVATIGNPALSLGIAITLISLFSVFVFRVLALFSRSSRKKLLELLRSVVMHPVFPWVVGFFAFWLPWALVSRVVFHYHYLPSYVFGLMIVSWCVAWLWHRQRIIAAAVLVVLLGFALRYLPFSVSWWTQTDAQVSSAMLVKTWLSADWWLHDKPTK